MYSLKTILEKDSVSEFIILLRDFNEEIYQLNFLMLYTLINDLISKVSGLLTLKKYINESDVKEIFDKVELECKKLLKIASKSESFNSEKKKNIEIKSNSELPNSGISSPTKMRKPYESKDIFDEIKGVNIEKYSKGVRYFYKIYPADELDKISNINVEEEFDYISSNYNKEKSTGRSRRGTILGSSSQSNSKANDDLNEYPFKQEISECYIF